MNNIIKIIFVIIGSLIGAGFASRKRNLQFFSVSIKFMEYLEFLFHHLF